MDKIKDDDKLIWVMTKDQVSLLTNLLDNRDYQLREHIRELEAMTPPLFPEDAEELVALKEEYRVVLGMEKVPSLRWEAYRMPKVADDAEDNFLHNDAKR